MNDGLKAQHRQAMIDVLAAHPGVEKVVLFGSRAMGTFTPESDVDLCLFGASLSLTDQAQLARKIDKLPMPQRVDLLRHKTIKDKKLLAHIRKHGVKWFRRARPNKPPSSTSTSGPTWPACARTHADRRTSGMEGEWDYVKLGDVAFVRSGYAFKSRDWTESGIPVVKIANVKDGRLDIAKCSYVSSDIASEASEFNLKDGDILIAMTGYIGDVALVQITDLPCVLNQRVGRFLITSHSRLHDRYLFYFLRSAETRKSIEGFGYGSAQPNVSPSLIHGIEISLPPLKEQRAIGCILGALDDKIELNRRMNRTLEAMAAAIFKAWFVDFLPVKAKAAGAKRFPSMPQKVFDALPTEFTDSPLGPIPKGWHVQRIGEVADINYGKNLPKKNLFETGIPVYGAAGVIGYCAEAMFDSPVLLITCRGTYSGTIHETWEPAFVTNNSMSIVPRSQWMNRHYLREILQVSDRRSVVTGSAQPQITLTHLNTLQILVAIAPVAQAYGVLATALWDKTAANKRVSQTLADIRDALLPKLLSGEIRVGDAKCAVEEVA